jgi:quinoprotein glucose dehydrogenase
VERPVPQTTVPGEQTSPTQPHPTKPPPFERQGVTPDDLIDFTPELRRLALDLVDDYVIGPIFTPPIVAGEGGKKGTLMLPSAAGGANWRGAAHDPETGMLYVPSMTLMMVNTLAKGDPNRVKFDYTFNSAGGWLLTGPDHLPIVKPPWGRITAIDLNKGDLAWVVPHGVGPKDHPLLAGLDLPERLGAAANGVLSNGGPLLTKTLLFAIQADESPEDMMRMGDKGQIAAWDKKTGELLWEHEVTPTPHGNPMTYLHGGRQYVVVAGGGGLAGALQPSELVAFALPQP